ncbi:uncharacterized protein LOC127103860 [Lathyrus oleraceus]|uniref:uncharacterized protein LOC127103860 n=1 Tax=Pisum sativum TaxID=3888 RepID=UPI0021CE8785|nr:uncharacterized protein LOC127103860 [Pisum sativum]
MPEPLSWWYKPDQHCAYHQGAPGHDIENIYSLKYEVQRLVRSRMVSFEDRAPNVKSNMLPAQVPHTFDKYAPYKYNATMIKDGQDVPLPASTLVVSIADVVKVTRSGRVFIPVFPKVVENVVVGNKAEVVVPLFDPINTPIFQSGESISLKSKDDNDEVLRLIKKSEFNVVEQLLQKPSKISTLSLLINFEAHHEAFQKVLEHAYVEHDVTVDQFHHIAANITTCNNLSFCDEELLEEARNHNMALLISMNYKEDALSNVLVDTGSSLNVLPKSTLARLSYQGAHMRYSGVIVMDIHPAYSCILGRPWIHEAGAVTSTLHQKLKFVKNGKLVIIGGEKALLVSHLSSFTYAEIEEAVGTPFQAFPVANVIQKTRASMSSLKDAQEIVQAGDTDNWGRVVGVV